MIKKASSLKQTSGEDNRAPKAMNPNFFAFLNERSETIMKEKQQEQKKKLLTKSDAQKNLKKADSNDLELGEQSSKPFPISQKQVRRPRESIGKINCPFRIISAEKNSGGIIGGKVHLQYADGERFVGTFENHERIQGKVIFASGVEYQGGFKDDLYHGRGKVTLANGTVIEAEWKQGQVQPRGKILYQNGDVYNGSMYRFKKDGYGQLILKDKRKRYVGQFQDGQITGWGILHDGNKKPIQGNWQKGILISSKMQ